MRSTITHWDIDRYPVPIFDIGFAIEKPLTERSTSAERHQKSHPVTIGLDELVLPGGGGGFLEFSAIPVY
jgi:hypothetical protein